MTFLASKLFWLLARPSHALLLLTALGVVLLWGRYTGAGRITLTLSLVGWLFAGSALSQPLLTVLENRFSPLARLPEQIDGVIVLGGAPNTETSHARGGYQLSAEAERLTTMIGLAQRYPQATVLHTGGSGIIGSRMTEADVVRRFLEDMPLDPARITLEERSRNTWENALYSKVLVEPQPGATWLLVTSAFHMPRAVGIFRRVGWPVIPYPIDYKTSGALRINPFTWDASGALALTDLAVREWIGLIAYRLLGRTSALFPAPEPREP